MNKRASPQIFGQAGLNGQSRRKTLDQLLVCNLFLVRRIDQLKQLTLSTILPIFIIQNHTKPLVLN